MITLSVAKHSQIKVYSIIATPVCSVIGQQMLGPRVGTWGACGITHRSVPVKWPFPPSNAIDKKKSECEGLLHFEVHKWWKANLWKGCTVHSDCHGITDGIHITPLSVKCQVPVTWSRFVCGQQLLDCRTAVQLQKTHKPKTKFLSKGRQLWTKVSKQLLIVLLKNHTHAHNFI